VPNLVQLKRGFELIQCKLISRFQPALKNSLENKIAGEISWKFHKDYLLELERIVQMFLSPIKNFVSI
jgi:hypothetical protein